jgi:tetratricopeptide (TPR) repeat protein
MATVAEALADAMRDHQAGRLDAAEAVYRGILAQAPDHAEAMRLLGLVANQRGQHQQAHELILRSMALGPTPMHHQNLGMVLTNLKRIDEAMASYRRAIELDPTLIDGHLNLGNLLRMAGRLDEAIACYRRVLEISPGYAAAYNNMGNVYSQQDKKDEALEAYRCAVAANPNFALAHYNLGASLKDRGNLEAALFHCHRAVELDPNNAEAHNSLGFLLAALNRPDQAKESYRRALALDPGYAQAHNNLGVTFFNEGQPLEALACYDRAVAAKPDYPAAHLNRSLATLLLGNFARGWPEYEWRWKVPGVPAPRAGFDRPVWRGEPLNGARILLSGEQGLGDGLQFVRYAPLVAARGGRVMLQVKPPLRRLLATAPAVESVVTIDDPPPAFDAHCPMMSLPLAFGTDLATIPADVPYVFADPAAAAAWRERLGPGLKVGLAWAGWSGHNRDHRRSLSLAALQPLASVKGVRFVSLQKGPAAEQTAAAPPGMELVDVTAELDDLADSAALVAALDLVISVDTSVAHLAGALAKPVWILLPYAPDFRWLLEREDSPWYPTARLIRQPIADSWVPVLARLTGDLHRLADGDRSVLLPPRVRR